MSYLIDTNVLSELRKGKRADAEVSSWKNTVKTNELWLSVIVIGEIKLGVELKRKQDPTTAEILERWLQELQDKFAERILNITPDIAGQWAILNATRTLPVQDAYLAATALTHSLTLVTRNTKDFQGTGVKLLNPFREL